MKWEDVLSKTNSEHVRLIYTEHVPPEQAGKLFAMIGPFNNFDDKEALQIALEAAVLNWNLSRE